MSIQRVYSRRLSEDEHACDRVGEPGHQNFSLRQIDKRKAHFLGEDVGEI